MFGICLYNKTYYFVLSSLSFICKSVNNYYNVYSLTKNNLKTEVIKEKISLDKWAQYNNRFIIFNGIYL